MAVPFGFSAGDFISAINLVQDVIKALKDSKGSSKEYLELITELRSLLTALIEVKARRVEIENAAQRTALQQAVQACENSVDEFLKRIEKYHSHLSLAGSRSSWRDARRKIHWHLTKPEELAKFRRVIASHVNSIQTIMITIQVSSTTLHTQYLRAQSTQHQHQQETLHNVQQYLYRIHDSFDVMKEDLTKNSAQSQNTIASLDSLKLLITAQTREIFNAVNNIQQSIPPQVLLQQPIMFLDALDRLAPIHLEWINSREAFLAVLKVRFQNNGLRKVEMGEFALQASKTKRDISLTRSWDTVFNPGQAYDMSMIFKAVDSAKAAMCPSCHYENAGKSGDDIVCENCNMTFRRITDWNESAEETHGPFPSTSSPAPSSSQERTRDEAEEQRDQMHDYRRVRVLCIPSNTPRFPPSLIRRRSISPSDEFASNLQNLQARQVGSRLKIVEPANRGTSGKRSRVAEPHVSQPDMDPFSHPNMNGSRSPEFVNTNYPSTYTLFVTMTGIISLSRHGQRATAKGPTKRHDLREYRPY